MPFKSEKQRRFLWMHEPKIAKAWAHGEHTKKNRVRKAAKKLLNK